jgi:glyoxylase-like metal-dependent hydrolase (beta-lactamase superfamily II)
MADGNADDHGQSTARQKPPFETEMVFEYGVMQQVEPGLRRLVCRNPNEFTFKGTNTYVVGEGRVAVIDPGPDDPVHVAALLDGLGAETVTHIVLTHCHADHSGAVAALKEQTGATTLGMPRAADDPALIAQARSGRRFVTPVAFDTPISDGGVIDGSGWTLTAIATPGHAPDHVCYSLDGTGILLSGDHVMGWNTTVIAPPEGSMGRYMGSLERLLLRNDRVYYPGHGGHVPDPARLVRALLLHRRMREAEVLDYIRQGFGTIETLLPKIYAGIRSTLVGAAALSLYAQIEWLVERGLVRTANQEPLSRDSTVVPVEPD